MTRQYLLTLDYSTFFKINLSIFSLQPRVYNTTPNNLPNHCSLEWIYVIRQYRNNSLFTKNMHLFVILDSTMLD